jgi:hypothetical protein
MLATSRMHCTLHCSSRMNAICYMVHGILHPHDSAQSAESTLRTMLESACLQWACIAAPVARDVAAKPSAAVCLYVLPRCAVSMHTAGANSTGLLCNQHTRACADSLLSSC